jgi:hypothetical protein
MNIGPVVYLRGIDFVSRNGRYAHYVKVGDESLTMQQGQTLFWPVSGYYVDYYHHPDLSTTERSSLLTKWMINGDHPPDINQALFDGNPIVDEFSMVISLPFQLTIRSGAYNSNSLAPILDEPWPSGITGTYEAEVGGYFIWIKDLSPGPHRIVSNGRGELGYHTETVVEIDVIETASDQPSLIGKRAGSVKDKLHFDEMNKILDGIKSVDSTRKHEFIKDIRKSHGM